MLPFNAFNCFFGADNVQHRWTAASSSEAPVAAAAATAAGPPPVPVAAFSAANAAAGGEPSSPPIQGKTFGMHVCRRRKTGIHRRV
jgi:hypothetical protein